MARRDGVANRERGDLRGSEDEQSIGRDQARTSLRLRECREGGLKFVVGAGVDDYDVLAERAGGVLGLPPRWTLSMRSVGV